VGVAVSADNVGKRGRWGRVKAREVGLGPPPYEPHEGTIIAFVPGGASLRQAQRDAYEQGRSDGRVIHVDAIDEADGILRYLMREDREGTRGQKLAPRYYAPRCSSVVIS
jgi:hypothetical protein